MAKFTPIKEVENHEIYDRHDEFVGWAAEFLVDLATGRIEYVRLSLAGGRDQLPPKTSGDSLAVPWSMIDTGPQPLGKWRVLASLDSLTVLAARHSPTD